MNSSPNYFIVGATFGPDKWRRILLIKEYGCLGGVRIILRIIPMPDNSTIIQCKFGGEIESL